MFVVPPLRWAGRLQGLVPGVRPNNTPSLQTQHCAGPASQMTQDTCAISDIRQTYVSGAEHGDKTQVPLNLAQTGGCIIYAYSYK